MKLRITAAMCRSLRDAAAESVTGRAHNPEISFDGELFGYGSSLMRGDHDIDFVNEFDLEEFVANWFGTGGPSRFRVSDARHCIEHCMDALQDRIDALAE